MACKIIRRYFPIVNLGVSINGITPPTMTPPVLVPSSTITLAYPETSPTDVIEIRAPRLGDTETLFRSRIYRETRGKGLNVFRDPEWPAYSELNYQFEGLSVESREALEEFFLLSLGKMIALTDYESRSWEGIILDPSQAFTQAGRGCQYTARFTFQGSLT